MSAVHSSPETPPGSRCWVQCLNDIAEHSAQMIGWAVSHPRDQVQLGGPGSPASRSWHQKIDSGSESQIS